MESRDSAGNSASIGLFFQKPRQPATEFSRETLKHLHAAFRDFILLPGFIAVRGVFALSPALGGGPH